MFMTIVEVKIVQYQIQIGSKKCSSVPELIFGATGVTGGRVKILASRVNLSENNAKCTAILPQNKATVLDLITFDA